MATRRRLGDRRGRRRTRGRAFAVPVNDYRGRKGQVFYASPQQPSVPEPLRGAVTELGRILGYTPHREASPGFLPLDVPTQGLSPNALLEAYNANPLAAAGFTGKGATIVFFAFSGYDQDDLDTFADSSGLPRFTPVLVGGQPGPSGAETAMDLEVAHAIAPDAQKVVVNARPTVEGDGAYEKIGQHVRVGGSAVPRCGVEFVDRVGMRRAGQRRRPGPRRGRPGDRAEARNVSVRCERGHRRSGMQGR